MDLSAEQRAAVERSGQDACVVAGPGSGKTRVLVERFAWLVENQGVGPARILAITFTEKAARMMKRRLVERFAHRPELRESIEKAWVMTIDAFCARLLRENAVEAGLAPDFSVLDEAAANRMRREAAETSLDKLFQEQPEQMRRLLEALALSTADDGSQADLAASLLDVHETMRLAGVRELPGNTQAGTPAALQEARRLAAEVGQEPAWAHLHDWIREFLELPAAPVTLAHFEVAARFKANLQGKKKGTEKVKELREAALPKLAAEWVLEWYAGLPELLRLAVARLDTEYRRLKRQDAAADFTDLGELTIELLESDAALRERITAQFDHVLMDELQDTNRLQWRLVELVRGENGRRKFFAVGDINQSIYGFRHADRTVFEGYRAELRAKGHAIDELRENYRSRPEILKAVEQTLGRCVGVESRELIAMREAAVEVVVEKLEGAGDRAQEVEAELVAARIADWRAREARPWGDFAILVRALGSAEPFERELEKRGIPFVVSGGRTFMETREARDLTGLLAALVNPLDEIATAGVLRGPLAGWTDERLLREGPEGRLEAFEKLFGRARRLAGFVPPDRLLAMVLDECGYAGSLTDRGRANVDKLLNWIRREHRTRHLPLAELLEHLEALRAAQAEAEAPPQQVSDSVNIMTIHAAKGLEYPVVFVSALQRRSPVGSPVLLFSKELGLGVKWRNPATGANLKDAAHEELSQQLKQRESAEEERLLYVAMTRAEDRLVLTLARQSTRSPLQKLVEAAFPTAAGSIGTPYAGPSAAPVEALPVESSAERRAETLLELPSITGQYDSSAAVTDVALFAACPRKYFLARYVGLQPEATRPGTGAIEVGLEVHKALAGEGADSEEALELKRRFEATELGQRAERADRREREFDFLLAIEDVVLRGQVDMWFEQGGELVLLDYKTDRDYKMDRDDAEESQYALQLRLYALALERYAGRIPDRAALCLLRLGRVAEVSLRQDDLDKARGMVRALAAAQDALEFPLKIGEQCRRCWFYGGVCPAKLVEG